MALRSKHGFTQYNRQDIFGGAYGLLNSPTGAMALSRGEAVVIRPDFWVAFLWKRLLGLEVLNATATSRLVRAYAFRGPPPSPFASAECTGTGGGLQLLLLKLENATATAVELPSAPAGAILAAWSLTAPGNGSPFGDRAALNGAVLPATIDVSQGDPRDFLQRVVQPPVRGRVVDGLVLPSSSITFVCYSEENGE